jgi:hypothetical protein
MKRPANIALLTREQVRGRLNKTAATRRDAVERARGELPSYTDDEVEEITGQFAALSANAAAEATARALAGRIGEAPVQVKHEPPGADQTRQGFWIYCLQHPAQVTAAIASAGSAFVAFAHWVLGLF